MSKNILANQQEIKPVSPKLKLEFMKKTLRDYPGIKATDTAIADEIKFGLTNLYEQDKAFIIDAISNAKDRTAEEIKVIINKVEEADLYLKKLGWSQEKVANPNISFQMYHEVGRLWAKILSTPENLDIQKEIKNCEESCLESVDGWGKTLGLMLPQVSKTGSVSIPLINEGWGFFLDSNETKVGYADFLAVGTNKIHNYDTFKKVTSFDSWNHDEAHREDASRMVAGMGGSPSLRGATLAARLRTKAEKVLADKVQDKNLFESAFFTIFHEDGDRTKSIHEVVSSKKENIASIKKNLLSLSSIPGETFKDLLDQTFNKVMTMSEKAAYNKCKLEYKALSKGQDPAANQLKEELKSKFGKDVVTIDNPEQKLTNIQVTINVEKQDFHPNILPIKQYSTNIKGAKSLGIKIEGNTYYEQIIDYLDNFDKGLDIIGNICEGEF